MNCEFHDIFHKKKKATRSMIMTTSGGKRKVPLCGACYNRFAIMQFEVNCRGAV